MSDQQNDDFDCVVLALSNLEQIRTDQKVLDSRLKDVIETLEASQQHEPANEQALRTAFAMLLPHQVRSAYFRSRVVPQLSGCVSFRSLMSVRTAGRDLGGVNHEWLVNDKIRGADFARLAGVVTPERYGVFGKSTIPDLEEIVIKPVKGTKCRGVFLRHMGQIIELRSGETLASTSKLQERIGAFPSEQWLVEEFLPDVQLKHAPARDLKFYCFYGRMALAWEIQRYPEYRCCWWSRDGHMIDTGHLGDCHFGGVGFDAGELAIVERMSTQIPAPFVRIDMLKSARGTVFGEFTPRPGEYDKFNARIDHELGRAFLLAESRLTESLLAGERFGLFGQFLSSQADE